MNNGLKNKLKLLCEKNNEFSLENDKLWCMRCGQYVKVRENRFSSSIKDHIRSKKHESAKHGSEPRQISMFKVLKTCQPDNSKISEYSFDLTQMMTEVDIPLHKVNHPSFKHFMVKYTEKTVPDESTLRKKYVNLIYEEKLLLIRECVEHGKLYFLLDESTDACNRSVLSVMVGRLNGQPSKAMLLQLRVLDSVNANTVSQAFINALGLIWPSGNIQYENILLIVTDAASYMIAAFKNLNKSLLCHSIHVTCVAHAVHRVCEKIREDNKEVNKFVSLMKKILLKSKERRHLYKTITQLPFPPNPVITRWGTFIETVVFYLDNWTKIKEFINQILDDVLNVTELKLLMESETFLNEFMQFTDFRFLPGQITLLESENNKISDVLCILSYIRTNLIGTLQIKFDSCLEKNAGLDTICNLNKKLSYGTNLMYAPLVSVSVERCFSQYKNMLTARRQNFNFENLEKFVFIYFNSSVNS